MNQDYYVILRQLILVNIESYNMSNSVMRIHGSIPQVQKLPISKSSALSGRRCSIEAEIMTSCKGQFA